VLLLVVLLEFLSVLELLVALLTAILLRHAILRLGWLLGNNESSPFGVVATRRGCGSPDNGGITTPRLGGYRHLHGTSQSMRRGGPGTARCPAKRLFTSDPGVVMLTPNRRPPRRPG
jgi:hypothetical protein